MVSQAGTMKRKRSVGDFAVPYPQKKIAEARAHSPATPEAATTRAVEREEFSICPLIRTLQQYGLLESITSCLSPTDLLSLALSCTATYSAMFPRPESVDNLLSKVRCSGNGVRIRQRLHLKSTWFFMYDCIEVSECSSVSRRQNIESRPCVSCKVTTCNECRIHCVYQSIYEAPSEPEEFANFSGYVLLDPFEVAILSPHHLLAEYEGEPAWTNPAADSTVGPYHDQGFLDGPLDSEQAVTPEKLSDVLDIDLGMVSLSTWSASSHYGFPSPALESLCKTVEERKLRLCGSCFTKAPRGYKSMIPELPKLPWLSEQVGGNASGLKECHCSLRSRILDRWQCVKCYESEDDTISNIAALAPPFDTRLCRCALRAKRIVCMWCWGEVTEGREAFDEVHAEAYAPV